MAEEIAAIERTDTWDLIFLPPMLIPSLVYCKQVYKIQTLMVLLRQKARLVTRGFQHEDGYDYDETFAHMAHMTTLRALLL